MKKNGFTLVEMLVSFAIVSVIAGIMMNILLTMKERSEKSYSLTQTIVTQANLTKQINNDLTAYPLTSVTDCGTNCYDFVYTTLGTKRLSINITTDVLTYGTFTKELPAGAEFGTPITITNTYVPTVPSGNNSVLKITIPITNIYNENSYNIKIVYQFVYAQVTLSL